MSNPRIRKVIQGVHMGQGHDGLSRLILKELKLDVRKLEDNDLVLCLNTYGDKMKVIGGRGLVVGYLKLPNKQRIMKDALQFLPQTFGAGGFDYDAAVGKALDLRFSEYPVRQSTIAPALAK